MDRDRKSDKRPHSSGSKDSKYHDKQYDRHSDKQSDRHNDQKTSKYGKDNRDHKDRDYKERDTNRDRNRDYNNKTKHEFKVKEEKKDDEAPIDKEKPSLALSGNLAKDTNMYNGVVIKYNEPSEARKPKKRWRLYVFKGEESLPFYQIHRQSAYLFGRERKIADIPIDHPSCSKQHAVFQYRLVNYKRDDGSSGRIIRPYIIDLGSANGTYINNERIEAQRYYELKEKDVIKFGFSSREYVLLHEESQDGEISEEFSSDSNEENDKNESPVTKKRKNDDNAAKKDDSSSSSSDSD